MGYYMNSNDRLFLTPEYVLFVEDKYNVTLNNYIQKNYDKICSGIEKKGLKFIYFPKLSKISVDFTSSLFEFLRYRHPVLYSFTDTEINVVINSFLLKEDPIDFYNSVIYALGLPDFEKPALSRNIDDSFYSDSKNKFTFSEIKGSSEKDFEVFFNWYFDVLVHPKTKYQSGLFQLDHEQLPNNYDADWYFSRESNDYSTDFKDKIDSLVTQGKFSVLADAVMYMLTTLKDAKPELIKKVIPIIESKKLLELKVILSHILIDKNYNIFLPDFGNIEVKMHALPKTVYLFFLRYPQGIRFKELYQHKQELLDIYNKVTNKYEKNEIEKAINDLVDMTNPSINQKCARIRESFRNVMDEHIAKYYYIDGVNGEPKKISLPKKLIDIRY